MNSIFSSFDFLCAELFGLKVKAHVPPAVSTVAGCGGGGGGRDPSPLRRCKRAADVPRAGSKGGSVEERKTEKQKESFPRFAPELDGIHCFETIVPH